MGSRRAINPIRSVPMQSFPLVLQLGMKRFNGHVFLAPNRLFFICTKQGGVWAQAIGHAVGGAVGGLIAAAVSGKPGEAPQVLDERALEQAVAENPGSMIMDASKIEAIKTTIWWRMIKFDGKKYGLPNGLEKALRQPLAAWAQAHGVENKGLT